MSVGDAGQIPTQEITAISAAGNSQDSYTPCYLAIPQSILCPSVDVWSFVGLCAGDSQSWMFAVAGKTALTIADGDPFAGGDRIIIAYELRADLYYLVSETPHFHARQLPIT